MAVELSLLPAEEAVASLEAKGYEISFDWRDVYAEEHAKVFTVAKMLRVDLLQTVQEALVKAETDGWDLKRFSQQLRPILEREGWWGAQEGVDPQTGEIKTVQLGSPRRLQTIFDTNLRTSYSAGRWQRGERSAGRLPLLLYRTMRDMRVRPAHARWDGITLPRTDAWWDTHYPPNGWRCRCIAYPISEADAGRLQAAWDDSEGQRGLNLTETAPPTETVQWVNPRTGEMRNVPVGIDPGFDYHPGKAAQAHLDKLLGEKESQFAASVQAPPAAYPRLKVVGQVSDSFRAHCAAVLNKIPVDLKDKVAAKDYDVVLCDKVVTHRPDLANVRPRGWPKGKTWKNVDGLCNSQSAAVAETFLRDRKWVPSPRAPGTLAHEFGHAVDKALNRASAGTTFMEAYRADEAGISDSDRLLLDYFLQPGEAGPSEAFAELFAIALGHPSSYQSVLVARSFPRCLEMIRREILARPVP